jgi:hypothetical protein
MAAQYHDFGDLCALAARKPNKQTLQSLIVMLVVPVLAAPKTWRLTIEFSGGRATAIR